MEGYRIENSEITFIDSELGIDIREDFSIPTFLESRGERPLFEKRGEIERGYFKRDGKLHGEHLIKRDGKVVSRCYYFEGMLHGPSYFFSGDILLSESFFIYGKLYGKVRRYYLSGDIKAVERYLDGKMTEEQEYFYRNDVRRGIFLYDMGEFLEAIIFWEDGSLKRVINSEEDRLFSKGEVFVVI